MFIAGRTEGYKTTPAGIERIQLFIFVNVLRTDFFFPKWND